jgi:hypothetical protein
VNIFHAMRCGVYIARSIYTYAAMSERGAARAPSNNNNDRIKKTPTTAFLYGLHEHHNGLAKRFSRVVLCTEGGGDRLGSMGGLVGATTTDGGNFGVT